MLVDAHCCSKYDFSQGAVNNVYYVSYRVPVNSYVNVMVQQWGIKLLAPEMEVDFIEYDNLVLTMLLTCKIIILLELIADL